MWLVSSKTGMWARQLHQPCEEAPNLLQKATCRGQHQGRAARALGLSVTPAPSPERRHHHRHSAPSFPGAETSAQGEPDGPGPPVTKSNLKPDSKAGPPALLDVTKAFPGINVTPVWREGRLPEGGPLRGSRGLEYRL